MIKVVRNPMIHRHRLRRIVLASVVLAAGCLIGSKLEISPARFVPGQSGGRAGGDTLVEPGIGIKLLKLGDSREEVLTRFPKKANIDSEINLPNCGTEYMWHDLSGSRPGEITVRFKDDRVFQIEISADRYHTAGGVKINDEPAFVRSRYKMPLSAYLLLGATPVVQGNRPLIFWTDRGSGVAFELAYSSTWMRRYVDALIVYKSGSDFCPNGVPPTSETWRELAPYSVEAPDRSAALRKRQQGDRSWLRRPLNPSSWNQRPSASGSKRPSPISSSSCSSLSHRAAIAMILAPVARQNSTHALGLVENRAIPRAGGVQEQNKSGSLADAAILNCQPPHGRVQHLCKGWAFCVWFANHTLGPGGAVVTMMLPAESHVR
jgi:hypothetical protein